MPKVHEKTARKDIYRVGKRVEVEKTDRNKKGYILDRGLPANDKDEIIVKKGQTYFEWFTRPGGRGQGVRHISLVRPKPSQLTSSDFLSTVYGWQEAEYTASDLDELSSVLEDLKGEVETLRDEQEEKRSNMPDSLQESDTGNLLQERYDALDELYNELDNIETSMDDDEDDWKDNWKGDNRDDYFSRDNHPEAEEDTDDDDIELTEEEEKEADRMAQEAWDEHLSEFIDEKLNEIGEALGNVSV